MDYLRAIGVQRWQRRGSIGQGVSVIDTVADTVEAVADDAAVRVATVAADVASEQAQGELAERSVAAAEGSLPVAEGSLSVAEGSLPVAEGSLPTAEGSLPAADGSPSEDEGSAVGGEAPVAEPDSWARIIQDMQSTTRCPVCQASTPILGEGHQNADWVFLIDAPSSHDIAEQQLLSGRAGKLFKGMLRALNLESENIYLSSIFKCPPSKDFKLSPSCNELLMRQLALIEPQKIVTFGEFTAQTLLKSNDNLATLRGSLRQLRHLNSSVAATHGIVECLNQPQLKAQVWEDLCRLLQ